MEELADAILALDVGNTTVRFGLFTDGDAEPRGTWEVTTPARLTVDEARLLVAEGFCGCMAGTGAASPMALVHAASALPVQAILSCVVPNLTAAIEHALALMCAGRPRTVGPGLKTGLRMRYDDPAEVGPDRIADSVAARASYGAPVIVVDLGTTTNIEVVDAQGAFAGGIIAPGLALGARSLSEAAARLPVLDLAAPSRVIGKSTREAMRAGVVFGEVARIDGLLAMVEEELAGEVPANADGEPAPAPTVVVTGEHAAEVARLLHHEARIDGTLTLRGLAQLSRLNAPRKRA